MWAIVPLFFISSGTWDSYNKDNEAATIDTLRISGDFNMALKGEVYFETALETASDGTPFSTLKLNLKNHKESHSLGFFISKQNHSKQITMGTYKVLEHIDGFLNYFDGVFGFAHIKELGELPFFAHKGKITIFHVGKDSLRGQLAVVLENPNGQRIDVTGNFTALKQNGN